jgi:ppGpp synthetase/RelA/SpoT-type nucleotidyltranferase
MKDALLSRYSALYEAVLVPITGQLEALIRDHLRGVPRIDRVCARAKTPESFMEKARKRLRDGTPRYSEPLIQIQDQIGARVIVFFKEDVDVVSEKVLRYFRHIEAKTVIPDSHWSFGYFGKHLVLDLPADAVPRAIDVRSAPSFFELQVRTLFQHAWSEAEHDVGYKGLETLNEDQTRRLAYTAAQAWGADRTFQELLGELTPTS